MLNWCRKADVESQMNDTSPELYESTMAKPSDRLSIDIGDLRTTIEQCSDSLEWKELALTAKIRVLIQLGIKVKQDEGK
jgi:hypothetical protein